MSAFTIGQVGSSGLSGGAIAGIVIGTLALLVLIGAILFVVFVGPVSVREQASDLVHRYVVYSLNAVSSPDNICY